MDFCRGRTKGRLLLYGKSGREEPNEIAQNEHA